MVFFFAVMVAVVEVSGCVNVEGLLSGEAEASGSASARLERVVTSFLFGRRRRGFEAEEGWDLVMRERRSECLMRRLSDLVVGKRDEELSFLRLLSGVEAVEGVVVEDLRMDLMGWEVRWVGCVGAILRRCMMACVARDECVEVREARRGAVVSKRKVTLSQLLQFSAAGELRGVADIRQ